jgi:hypothetical protein
MVLPRVKSPCFPVPRISPLRGGASYSAQRRPSAAQHAEARIGRPRLARAPLNRLAVLAAGATLLSCGAGLRRQYEEDVRFEHCMGLDARPDMKPSIRSACWEEWSTFFTFGQTRDRIDYAHLRIQQLSQVSNFDEADWVRPASGAAVAVPEPTSALAPPPMLLNVDGGPGSAPGVATEGSGAARGRVAACLSACDNGLDPCRRLCRGPPCDLACRASNLHCRKRCEP